MGESAVSAGIGRIAATIVAGGRMLGGFFARLTLTAAAGKSRVIERILIMAAAIAAIETACTRMCSRLQMLAIAVAVTVINKITTVMITIIIAITVIVILCMCVY